jgi:hypothetical protein
MADILIRGGTVIDGTGTAACAADVRVTAGLISEIGRGLAPRAGEEVHDASGCYVTPGFIEAHTHYDATMWWQPDLDPLPGNGATTIILGNCGFAAAPMSRDKAARLEMVKIFSFFEDIPIGPFLENVPWDWEKWSEYKASLTSKVRVPANYAIFVGHIAIRLAVMGLEAWERVATPAEIARMAELLEDALGAGALGLSDNMHDHDGNNRQIPTLVADDAEFRALFDVLERYPAASYQVIVDTAMRKTGPQSLERLERLLKGTQDARPDRRRDSHAGVPEGHPAGDGSLGEEDAGRRRGPVAGLRARLADQHAQPGEVADLRAVERLRLARGGAGRDARGKGAVAGRSRLAGAGARVLGHEGVEALADEQPAGSLPARFRERRRPGRHHAEAVRRQPRPAPLRRDGAVDPGERHAFHRAHGAFPEGRGAHHAVAARTRRRWATSRMPARTCRCSAAAARTSCCSAST